MLRLKDWFLVIFGTDWNLAEAKMLRTKLKLKANEFFGPLPCNLGVQNSGISCWWLLTQRFAVSDVSKKKPPIGDIELESSRVILLVVKAAKKFVGILRNSSGTRWFFRDSVRRKNWGSSLKKDDGKRRGRAELWVDFTQVPDLDDHVWLLVSMDLDGRKSSNIAAEVFLVVGMKKPCWQKEVHQVDFEHENTKDFRKMSSLEWEHRKGFPMFWFPFVSVLSFGWCNRYFDSRHQKTGASP